MSDLTDALTSEPTEKLGAEQREILLRALFTLIRRREEVTPDDV